jgi:hypothetical protein
MKRVISILFLSTFLNGFSQSWLPINHDTLLNRKHEFILTGTADYASTSLRNSLTQKLFYGGEITNEIKDKSRELQRGVNLFGSDLNAEVEYRNYAVSLFKNQNWGFVAKAGYYSFINALYSKDLFDLTFYGNQGFIGDTAFISGTKFSSYSFQKIGFGWLNKKSKSSIALNLFNLSNYRNASIRTGELFQSAEIDSLSINYDGEASFTNSSTFITGLGIGIDVDLRFSVLTKKNKPIYYQFLAKNIGFASFIEPINKYAADSVFSFTGLTLNQVLNGASILDSNFSVLDTFNVQKTTTKRTVFFPGFLQFSKLVDSNSDRKLQEFYGVRMFLCPAYNPLIFAGMDYRISLGSNALMNIGITGSYGGFSRYRLGMYSSLKMKNWQVGIASENILGRTGQSFFIRLQCAF